MFDNDYILTEKVLDSSRMEVQDSNSDGILSRLYSDLLKKFMEGIPNRFVVNEKLHDNRTGTSYSSEVVLDSYGNAMDCPAIFVS